MGAIHNLLRRLGFVKLDHYGLRLTPDDRVYSSRPVLDDGFGGRVVGWRDDDFAAMQLAPYGAPKAAIAPPLPVPPTRVVIPPRPVTVAPEPVVEDDDWEWKIALARARAAEDIEQSLDTLEDAPRPPRPTGAVTKPMATVIPVPTLPMSVPAARFSPVVRTSQNVVPRRFARGTQKTGEQTVRTTAAQPVANDDVTRPAIVLPESGRVAR